MFSRSGEIDSEQLLNGNESTSNGKEYTSVAAAIESRVGKKSVVMREERAAVRGLIIKTKERSIQNADRS